MTTTESPITLTGHDRHRILDDLWAVPGLADHIVSMTIRATMESTVQLGHGSDRDYVTDLQTAASLFDDARTVVHDYPDSYDGRPSVHVHVAGTYRGVGTEVFAAFRGETRSLVLDTEVDQVLNVLAEAVDA